MKSIIQSKPSLGTAGPYRLDEWIRTADKQLYLEVEIPVPTHNRTGPPIAYLFLYLFLRGNISIALANPGQGVHDMIESIRKHKEYETAFRHKWPLFDSLLVDDQHMAAEFAKRPVLLSAQDPNDHIDKWMVGRQVTLPPNAPQTEMTDIELQALESLIQPSLKLQSEAQDAFERVGTALIRGEFAFPKDRYEKFMEMKDKVEPIISGFLDILKDSGIGR